MNAPSVYQTMDLWTAEQCEIVKRVALEGEAHEATVQQDGQSGARSDIRSATRWFIDGAHYPELVGELWHACRRYNIWGFDIEQLPGIEVIRYLPDDFYTRHTDWGGTYTRRKISASVQLSDPKDYEGGEVNLHIGPEDDQASQVQGAATMWPSWTLHSVNPVTKGERWCAVGWVLGPLFR
jgi:PKHD-type hydroxylase